MLGSSTGCHGKRFLLLPFCAASFPFLWLCPAVKHFILLSIPLNLIVVLLFGIHGDVLCVEVSVLLREQPLLIKTYTSRIRF